MPKTDTYASASSYEGFGLTAVEAASAGLYPVLSDIPAHSRTRERLGYGTLTDFASSEAAACFVEQARAGAMTVPSGPSREEALRSFGWAEAAGQIEEIYNRSLGNRSRSIGGLDVQVMDLPMAVRRIYHLIRRREPRVITFCNAHTVNTARRNTPFANALRGAFILNDGVGLDWASRLLYGRPFPANLNGTDLVPTFLLRCSRPLRVYLVGSSPGIAARAGDMLKRRNAKLQIVGTDHGFFEEEDEGDLVARIAASAPDVVLVGMGHPRQEIWAERHVQALGVPVICVGALFDFTAEAVLRAPAWMRRTRLEWGYRLFREPRRLARRYLVGNVSFMTRRGARCLARRSYFRLAHFRLAARPNVTHNPHAVPREAGVAMAWCPSFMPNFMPEIIMRQPDLIVDSEAAERRSDPQAGAADAGDQARAQIDPDRLAPRLPHKAARQRALPGPIARRGRPRRGLCIGRVQLAVAVEKR